MSRLTLFSFMGALIFSTGSVMAQGNEVDQRIEKFCAEQKLYNEHVCTSTTAGLSLLEERDRFDSLFQPKPGSDSASGNNTNTGGSSSGGSTDGGSMSWSDESGQSSSSTTNDDVTFDQHGMQ